jgi:hypothetical protein
LTQAQVEEEENLRLCAELNEAYVEEVEERQDSSSPVYDDWLSKGGSEAIKTVTNFSDSEFHVLWGILQAPLTVAWTTGRGNKSKVMLFL